MGMMSALVTEGVAESGYGVKIAGCHCEVKDFPGRANMVMAWMGPDRIASWESEGWISFLALRNTYQPGVDRLKLLTYRREPHRFFVDLSTYLSKHRVHAVRDISLTGSLGSLQLVLLYEEAPATLERSVD